MKQITFHFDVVSPFAYLAFHRLPQVLAGCSCQVSYRPLLFAGLLRHWGQLGPAEIAPKRDWTYRQVLWLAHRLGVPLRMPACHPFNPLSHLRLLLAHGLQHGLPGQANRFACEAVLARLWQTGEAPDHPAGLDELALVLSPDDPASLIALSQGDEVKALLRANTESAVAAGVFGVPTCVVEGRSFWGLDALDMLGAFVRADPWFEQAHWDEAAQVAQGVARQRSGPA